MRNIIYSPKSWGKKYGLKLEILPIDWCDFTQTTYLP
jgi:hypothetical protein